MPRLAHLLVGLSAPLLLPQEPAFRTTVPLVIAPTTVTDRAGRYVDGLSAKDFLLYDNRRPQSLHLDVAFVPISLVVAVQSSAISAPALQKCRKIGSMIEPLIIGERGEAAVLAFDSRLRMVQPFTSDPHVLTKALKQIQPGDSGSRMIDAVAHSVRLLAGRPPNRRRVVLLLSEAKDRSSETKLEDAVSLAQHRNVTIYPVTYSAFFTAFTTRPEAGPPPSNGGLNLLAIFIELARLASTNTAEAFSKYTGGRRLSFLKQRSLEQAVSSIGEELHSQYLLSYTPPRDEPGFHEIEVRIWGRTDLIVRTRPGYWPVAN